MSGRVIAGTVPAEPVERSTIRSYDPLMALFLVERQFAEALNLDADAVEGVIAVNDEVGVRWVTSFLSADKRKSYCLYEAENEAAIVEAARRVGVPADVVVAVDEFIPQRTAPEPI